MESSTARGRAVYEDLVPPPTDTVSTLVTIAGSPGAPPAHVDASFSDGLARLSSPVDVAVSPDGHRVYVADTGNRCVRVCVVRAGVFCPW